MAQYANAWDGETKTQKKHYSKTLFLGNGLKWLEWAKVGLIAHHMQNFLRNMISILFLMCGGLMMSKLRILDAPPSWDFNLGEFMFGGKFK